jgi:hypothetical protein
VQGEKISAVTKQKKEGAFLLEWIASHKLIGFTHIVILSNKCKVGSDEMQGRLKKAGEIIGLTISGIIVSEPVKLSGLDFQT